MSKVIFCGAASFGLCFDAVYTGISGSKSEFTVRERFYGNNELG